MPNFRKLSDAELTALLKLGDSGAFAEIYERFKGRFYVHAFHRLEDREETKDLLQQLFATLWEQRGQLPSAGNCRDICLPHLSNAEIA